MRYILDKEFKDYQEPHGKEISDSRRLEWREWVFCRRPVARILNRREAGDTRNGRLSAWANNSIREGKWNAAFPDCALLQTPPVLLFYNFWTRDQENRPTVLALLHVQDN